MLGVQICRVDLDRPSDEVASLFDLLDPVERARAAMFRSERDRRRFVVARGTLRVLLGEYTSKSPASVSLRILPGGKPALADAESTGAWCRGDRDSFLSPDATLHFNVSHCGDMALYAFSDREVGIDIERLDVSSDMSRVVAHFFAPEEGRVFDGLDGVERSRYFLRTWVRKEAYLKARGEGLAIDPARVMVAESIRGGVRVVDEGGVSDVDVRYAVHDLAGFDGHIAAIAVRTGEGERFSGAGTGRLCARPASFLSIQPSGPGLLLGT